MMTSSLTGESAGAIAGAEADAMVADAARTPLSERTWRTVRRVAGLGASVDAAERRVLLTLSMVAQISS